MHRSQNRGSAGFAPSGNFGYSLYVTSAHVVGGLRVSSAFRTSPFAFVRRAHNSIAPFAIRSRADPPLADAVARSHPTSLALSASGAHLEIPHGTGVTSGHACLRALMPTSPQDHPFALVYAAARGSFASTKQNGPDAPRSGGMNPSPSCRSASGGCENLVSDLSHASLRLGIRHSFAAEVWKSSKGGVGFTSSRIPRRSGIMWDMYVEINQPWSVAGPSRGSKFRASNPAVHLANASAHGKHSMPFTVVLFDPR